METSKPVIEIPPASVRYAFRRTLGRRRNLLLAQGAGIALLGVLAIAWPAMAPIEHDSFVGLLFLASGASGIAALIAAEDAPGFLWTMLTAALSLLSGILLIWRPGGVPVSLTLVLTALFSAEGAFQAAISFSCRRLFSGAWGWMLLSGVADLVLASLVMLGWPNAAGRTLELFVGINLMSSGWAAIMIAVDARRSLGPWGCN